MKASGSDILLRTGLFAAAVFCFVLLFYFTPRSNFIETFCLELILFVLYYLSIQKEQLFTFRQLVIAGVLFRLIGLFSTPALSDDYFRFIWDGEMWVRHVNPFAFTPDMYIAAHPEPFLNYLHQQMNSAEYYTVYPAVLQFIFGMAAMMFPASVYGALLVMKIFIFAADCLAGFVLYKYCRFKNIEPRKLCWYFLNPLVIIELVGNCHFEALLILFLIGTLYFIERKQVLAAGTFWALTICSKLLPLMLAPLFLRQLGFKKFFIMGIVTLIVSVVLFIPFIDAGLLNIQYSISKFYDLFEFNASFYYLINWIGHFFTPEDISDQVARCLGIVAFSAIIFLSFLKYNKAVFLQRCLFIFSIYFLMTTMVHPWYITTLVAIGCLTSFKYPMVFTLLIPLSYYPYSLKIFDENMLVILVEYGLLFLFIFWEIHHQRNIILNNDAEINISDNI